MILMTNKENVKMWYQSKTLWINILGAVVVLLQYALDQKLVDPALVTTLLAVLNLVLRLKKGEQETEIAKKLF